MANIFIGILSCRKNAALRRAARETWLRGCPVPYAFFVGEGEPLVDAGDDVVELAVPDGRILPPKVNAMIKWVHEHSYSHLARLDDDCYVRTDRLLNSGFHLADFIGCKSYGDGNSIPDEVVGVKVMHSDFITGCALWLNETAMELILESQYGTAQIWAEDQLMSSILHNRCQWKFDSRYETENWIDPRPDNDVISTHHCSLADMHIIDSYFHGVSPVQSSKFHPGETVELRGVIDVQREPRFGNAFTLFHLESSRAIHHCDPPIIARIMGQTATNRDGRTWWLLAFINTTGWVDESLLHSVEKVPA